MTRLARLEARRTDSNLTEIKNTYEYYKFSDEPEVVRYIIGCMQPVDPEYTMNTYKQGECVKNQLRKGVDDIEDFRYQGSVITDTHIKAHSDIDLLVFRSGWHFCRHPLKPANPYTGDTKQDLREFRSSNATTLETAFPEVDVDDSGSVAISLEGGSLSRKVDVVPAVWEESIESDISGNDVDRGVRVFNRKQGTFASNYPFKSKQEISDKDSRCLSGMRKAARLMKSVKADSETVKMTSYDITAIAWNMPGHYLQHTAPNEIRIFECCRLYLRELIDDDYKRNALMVPDGSRPIFCPDGASLQNASSLLKELDKLASEIPPSVNSNGLPISLMELKAYRPTFLHEHATI